MNLLIPPTEVYSDEALTNYSDAIVTTMAKEWDLTPLEEAMVVPLVKDSLQIFQQIEGTWKNALSLDFQSKFKRNFLSYLSNSVQVMINNEEKVQGIKNDQNLFSLKNLKNTNFSENSPQKVTEEYFESLLSEIKENFLLKLAHLRRTQDKYNAISTEIDKALRDIHLLSSKIDDLEECLENIENDTQYESSYYESNEMDSGEESNEAPTDDNLSKDLIVAAASDQSTPSANNNKNLRGKKKKKRRNLIKLFHKGHKTDDRVDQIQSLSLAEIERMGSSQKKTLKERKSLKERISSNFKK